MDKMLGQGEILAGGCLVLLSIVGAEVCWKGVCVINNREWVVS